MQSAYHIQITTEALQNRVSPTALQTIIAANLAQDRLRGQINHPEYHFDDNAFDAGEAYIQSQREVLLATLLSGQDPAGARRAFGRLSHAAQDFYAHSNYLALWLARHAGEGKAPEPQQVDCLDPEVLGSPELRSGRIYFLEILTFVPVLRPLARRLLPRDSHAWMNLDGPECGPLFAYALSAARARTAHEFNLTAGLVRESLGAAGVARFTGREA